MSVASKTPATSILRPHPSPTPDEVERQHEQSHRRALMSSGKGKSIVCGTLLKRQRVNTSPAAIVERSALVSRGAASSVPLSSRPLDLAAAFPPLFLYLDRLIGYYDEDVCSRDCELCEAREVNAALQFRLGVLVERNGVLESDDLSVKRSKREWDAKLLKLKSRCAKDEGEITSLKSQLSLASDLHNTRVDEAVAGARDKMTRGF